VVVVGVVTGTSLLSRSRPSTAWTLPQLLQLTEHCLGIGRVPMYHPSIRMEVLISLAGLATAALLLVVAGVITLIGPRHNAAAARDEAAAVAAAKDCITATQAPDVKAMADSQRRIVECSTENFAAQANLYGGLLADAYKTVNAQVKISDMRAAPEKHNPDGSIDVLVATRVAMSNNQQIDQELSYRLRVRMAGMRS